MSKERASHRLRPVPLILGLAALLGGPSAAPQRAAGEPSRGREAALERARLEQGIVLAERTVHMLGELQTQLGGTLDAAGRAAE